MSKARQLADNAAAEPNKNMVINGAMQVNQRGNVTGKTAATFGGPDRFALGITSHGTYSISQSTTVPTGYGFPNSYKLDCTTADTSIAANAEVTIQYKMEGQDLQRLKKGTSSAEAVTISFWCRSNLTGTYTLEIYDSDNTRHFPQNYTISSADTWEHKVLTFAGDTTGTFNNDNAHSAVLVWWLAAGSNYTGGTQSTAWASASSANTRVSSSIVNMSSSTSNEFLLTGVQMEVGSYNTPFEFESYETTLEKCYRYYLSSYVPGTTPGASNALNADCTLQTAWNDGNAPFPHFPKEMRDTPTVTIRARGANTTGQVNQNGSAVSATPTNIQAKLVHYISTSTGTGAATHYTTYSYECDAEL